MWFEQKLLTYKVLNYVEYLNFELIHLYYTVVIVV